MPSPPDRYNDLDRRILMMEVELREHRVQSKERHDDLVRRLEQLKHVSQEGRTPAPAPPARTPPGSVTIGLMPGTAAEAAKLIPIVVGILTLLGFTVAGTNLATQPRQIPVAVEVPVPVPVAVPE